MCVYATFCLYIQLLMDIWARFLHLLIIVSNAAVNMGVREPESLLLVLLGVYLQVGLLDNMQILRLTFWATAKLLSTGAAPFHVPTSSARGFRLLHFLTNTVFFFPLIIAVLVVWICYLLKVWFFFFRKKIICSYVMNWQIVQY